MSEKTDYRFKILYVFGVLLVLCGHIEETGIPFFKDVFPSDGLSLALFMFCSGFLFKDSHLDHPLKYIGKKCLTLIIPYFIYNVIYAFIAQFLRQHGFAIGSEISFHNLFIEPFYSGHQFLLNLGGWFIFPLFFLEVFNVLLRKLLQILKLNLSEYVIFCIYLILGLIGIELAILGYKNGNMLILTRWLYFFPFFGFGGLYKRKFNDKLNKKSLAFIFLITIIIRALIFIFYGSTPIYRTVWMNDLGLCPFMPVLVGISGIMFLFIIADFIPPIIGKSKIINLIANSTYSIMINQFLSMFLLKLLFSAIFSDFNYSLFTSDIWYYYKPFNLEVSLILYIIVAIALPVMFQLLINAIKKLITKKR